MFCSDEEFEEKQSSEQMFINEEVESKDQEIHLHHIHYYRYSCHLRSCKKQTISSEAPFPIRATATDYRSDSKTTTASPADRDQRSR